MHAGQITALRPRLEAGEVPGDEPQTGGAVMRVEACGICRSDWHSWKQDLGWIRANRPIVDVLARVGERKAATSGQSR